MQSILADVNKVTTSIVFLLNFRPFFQKLGDFLLQHLVTLGQDSSIFVAYKFVLIEYDFVSMGRTERTCGSILLKIPICWSQISPVSLKILFCSTPLH